MSVTYVCIVQWSTIISLQCYNVDIVKEGFKDVDLFKLYMRQYTATTVPPLCGFSHEFLDY